jgi:hypothetical protein
MQLVRVETPDCDFTIPQDLPILAIESQDMETRIGRLRRQVSPFPNNDRR